MSPLILSLEIAMLTGFLCLLHGFRRSIGAAPFLVVIGLLESFLFVAGKPFLEDANGVHLISSNMWLSEPTHISTQLFLTALLSGLVIEYILEGTREAQRFLVAIFAVYVVHGLIEFVLYQHAANPPDNSFPYMGDVLPLQYSLWTRTSSFVSIMADFITMAISYQFLRNVMARLPLGLHRLPIGIPIFFALVFAMAMDSFAFSLMQGHITGTEGLRFPQKIQSAFAAGVPLALYVQSQLMRRGKSESSVLLDRSSLEILDLRARVAEIEARLEEQREQYDYVKSTFSKYVSSDVADSLLSDPSKVKLGGEVRDVTILFADVRGYSTLAESMDAAKLIDMLNDYLARMSEVIFKHHGMINEFEGDGILAVFGAPIDLENHADCAVSAGEEMLAVVKDINVEWEQSGRLEHWRSVGIENLAIRIGIHSGTVVAGNIGTDKRMKYAVIGDTVNTAARIEALNKELNTSLLFSTPTKQRLREAHPSEALGSHRVKGKSDAVEVYTVAAS